VEFQQVLKACVDTHNKAAYLLEVYKCGSYNLSDYSNCVNYTDYGGTQAAYATTVFNGAKLTAVRFFQASVEILGRGFFVTGAQSGGTPIQTLNDVSTPSGYTASPASPTQLDVGVLDYSLSMRPNVSLLNNPNSLRNATSNCVSHYALQTLNMSTEANRIWNMVKTPAQPWHSQIRPEYAALAAAQDARSVAMNLTPYGSLLTALGLSSSGTSPSSASANPLAGGLLDTNTSNYLVSNPWGAPGGTSVPNLPRAIWSGTFQRAHDSIVADLNGLFPPPGTPLGDYPNNVIFELLFSDAGPDYLCWNDPSIGGGCNSQSLFAYGVLMGYSWPLFPTTYQTNYPYAIRYGWDWNMHYSIATVWTFNMYDRGLFETQTWFVEPYRGVDWLNVGITTCFPDLIYTGGRANNNYCGNCQYS